MAISIPLPIDKGTLRETVDKQKINALILDLDNGIFLFDVLISYQVEYITSDGQRKIFKNESKTGSFFDALRGVIQDSKAGDLFIFDDIQSNCSSASIRPVLIGSKIILFFFAFVFTLSISFH